MAHLDKASPGISITLTPPGSAPVVKHLVFDMWAFSLIEKETGKNALNGELFSNPSAQELLVLIWAGIQHEGECSLKEVGQAFSIKQLEDYVPAIQKAFEQASGVTSKKNSAPKALASEQQ